MGSIPAFAGEPLWAARGRTLHAVYPRVCGGTHSPQTHLCVCNGLSPRLRGNPIGSGWIGVGCGSIPAFAGEPGWSVPVVRSDAVYPRVCGGTSNQYSRTSSAIGLSPRLRGNGTTAEFKLSSDDSIPAFAGEWRCH